MKNIFTIFVLIFISGCCQISSLHGPPGDHGAQEWKAPSVVHKVEETIIDCEGKERKSITVTRSMTTIRNCVVNGGIIIKGKYRSHDLLVERSRRHDYVDWIRKQSPSHIVIEDTKIVADGRIPLYIFNGSWDVKIRNVTITGPSNSVMIYLDSETSRITIKDSYIDGSQASREVIAVDASDHNLIENNVIVMSDDGGIFLYRNCGEEGLIRHTTPSYNQIINNKFKNGSIRKSAIFVGSREGDRCYCDDDKGYNIGSSQSDLDHSRLNLVQGNSLDGARVLVRDRHSNTVVDNR